MYVTKFLLVIKSLQFLVTMLSCVSTFV